MKAAKGRDLRTESVGLTFARSLYLVSINALLSAIRVTFLIDREGER